MTCKLHTPLWYNTARLVVKQLVGGLYEFVRSCSAVCILFEATVQAGIQESGSLHCNLDMNSGNGEALKGTFKWRKVIVLPDKIKFAYIKTFLNTIADILQSLDFIFCLFVGCVTCVGIWGWRGHLWGKGGANGMWETCSRCQHGSRGGVMFAPCSDGHYPK